MAIAKILLELMRAQPSAAPPPVMVDPPAEFGPLSPIGGLGDA